MFDRFNETVACPGCHHTDHAISKELRTFTLWYGRVRRPALYCTHCPSARPVVLPVWLWMKWGPRDWQEYAK